MLAHEPDGHADQRQTLQVRGVLLDVVQERVRLPVTMRGLERPAHAIDQPEWPIEVKWRPASIW